MIKTLFGLWFLAFLFALAPGAGAQSPAEETHIPSLRLYPAPPALQKNGIHLAYVPQTVSPGNGRYTCGGLNDRQIEAAARGAIAALQRIPDEAWKKIQLKYLLLCSTTKSGAREIGGIPVPPLRLLMLAAGENSNNGGRFVYTVLHELYHMIEMQNGGLEDSDWNAAFSGYDNSYGAEAGKSAFGSGGIGFINGYGRSFAHEERAEIFAIHLLAPAALGRFIKDTNDGTLAKKRAFVVGKANALLGENLF